MVALSAMALLVLAIGLHGWYTGGWPSRMPKELRFIPSETAMWNERNPQARVGTCFVYAPTETTFDEARCLTRESGRPNHLILGDSFAADAYVYLSTAYPKVNFLQATAGNCHPLFANVTGDALCKDLLQHIFDTFLPGSTIDGVILSAAWDPGDLDLLERTIERLKSRRLRVAVIGSGIRLVANIQPLIYQSRRISVPEVERFVNSKIPPFVVALNDTMRGRFTSEIDAYIDVQSIMCEGTCTIFHPDRSGLIYLDFGHLTLAGSLLLCTEDSLPIRERLRPKCSVRGDPNTDVFIAGACRSKNHRPEDGFTESRGGHPPAPPTCWSCQSLPASRCGHATSFISGL